jgi:thiamine biosynthesis lipoprotein
MKKTIRVSVLAGTLIQLLLLLGVLSCSDFGNKPHSRTAFYFGTLCTVTLLERVPEQTYNLVFNRLEEIEKKMSINIQTSEVSQVNGQAGIRPVRVSEDTFYVIEQGVHYSHLTEGHFDISVGPLVALWNIGGDNPGIPEPAMIEEKLSAVGFKHIRLNRTTTEVFLEKRGMMLDLGGIAKGYAAEEARRILKERGIERGIIDIGGNILVMGSKPGDSPWRIGIQDPIQPRGAYCGILKLKNATAVTSGIYERYFEKEGKRYHHILDPQNGYPVDNTLLSVTVVAEDSIMADALSTGLLVKGLSEGIRFIERFNGLEAVFITKNRKIHVTPGLSSLFSLSSAAYTVE